MERYFDVVQNRQGTALPGVTVTVYDSNGNLATLYSNPSFTPTTNPIYTNSDGEYAFYAANGTYSINLNLSGFFNETKLGVVLFDPSDAQTANQINFLQAGSGAVTRTVQSKLRDTVSVKDFGAVGDGVTDDSTAIQNAVNTMTSGGTLVFPFGTYKINTSILIQNSDITILGNGSTIDATTLTYNAAVRGSGAVFRFITPNTQYSTTLSATANAGDYTISLTSATGAAAGQLIRCASTEVQYRNSTVIAYYNDQNKIVDVSGTTITLESPLAYNLTVSPYTVSVIYRAPISNFVVDGFTMLGGGVRQNPLGNGLGPCGVWGSFVDNLTVKNCRFYGFQGIAVGLDYFADFNVYDCYFEGIDPNIVVVEGQNSSFYGAFAIRGRRANFSRCTGQRVRHLYDAAEVYQIVESDSIASNTHRAAFGSHEEVYDLNVVGNVSNGCYAGCVIRALTANVVGNTFNGGSYNNPSWSGITPGVGVSASSMLHTDPGQAVFNISNNRITFSDAGVTLPASFEQLTISNNVFSGKSPAISFTNADANFNNLVITGNTFNFDGTGSNTTAIGFQQTTGINGTVNNVLIANNISYNQSFAVLILYGCNDVAAPANNIKISDNVGVAIAGGGASNAIQLRNAGFYGDNIVIRGNSQFNDTSGVTSVCSGQQYRLSAFPVVEFNDDTNRTFQGNRTVATGGSSSPTVLDNATLLTGSVIQNNAAAPGGPDHWVVTTVGTNGTITGVTADTTAGSPTVTLIGNDLTKVYVGSYITITGSGAGRARVVSIDPTFTTATLSLNMVNTVTGAAVSRANPVVSAGANLV